MKYLHKSEWAVCYEEDLLPRFDQTREQLGRVRLFMNILVEVGTDHRVKTTAWVKVWNGALHFKYSFHSVLHWVHRQWDNVILPIHRDKHDLDCTKYCSSQNTKKKTIEGIMDSFPEIIIFWIQNLHRRLWRRDKFEAVRTCPSTDTFSHSSTPEKQRDSF